MIENILQTVNERVKLGQKVVLVTLMYKSGNAPGAAGQLMAVFEDGTTIGTIGGGKPEYLVIEQAKEALKNNEKTFEFEYDLTENDIICGGKVSGYACVLGVGKQLVLFGAGHVNQAIAKLAKPLGFTISVIDDRDELRSEFENVTYYSCSLSEINKAKVFSEDSYVVIATRGHRHDREALLYSINETTAYLGMIGSKRKVKEIFNWLVEKGISKETISGVYAPIGLEIADGTPNEIAISILAEILLIKNNGNLVSKKTTVKI